MPCCTYLSDKDFTAPTSDAELNQLLAEVRKATGRDWRIREVERQSGLWRPAVALLYELMVCISGPEFQIVNFYRPDRKDDEFPSINTLNSAGYVAAYLYGVIAGCQANPPGKEE